jgi:GT2 family glycosyltransferase
MCYKTVFNQLDYDETIFWEDVDFNIRANTAYKLAYASEPKVYYTMNSQNQITKLL